MQTKTMCLDATIDLLKNMIDFFKNYRIEGFAISINEAKDIANNMDVEFIFPKKHRIIIKKQFICKVRSYYPK